MDPINLDTFKENLEQDSKRFLSFDPYPCIVLDNFLNKDYLEGIGDELRSLVNNKTESIFNPFIHLNARVWGTIRREGFTPRMNEIVDTFQSTDFLSYLEELTQIKGLIADSDLITGGYVVHKQNGFVNLHVDHRTHPQEKKWSRKVLLLYYLNDDYQDSYNGHLELWDKDAKKMHNKIAPLYNRCVIQTIEDGYVHGLPETINFPEGDCRKALVLWYYVEEKDEIPLKVTKYYSRPVDSIIKKAIIHSENILLHFHYVFKRVFKMDDGLYIKIQKFFRK
ncbi:MAG: hypothetical protein ACJAT2_000226 [Bacteriovoracaceae bacterium]|jgi:hypothetical protein